MPQYIGGVSHPTDTDTYDPTGTTAGAGDLGALAASVAQKAADEASLAGLAARDYADQQDAVLRALLSELESRSGTSGSATAVLAAYRGDPTSSLHVAITGDTSWAREWATTYGQHLPTNVRREFRTWTGSTWQTTVDNAGQATPASGGVVLSDGFGRTGGLNGTMPDVGPQAWVGTAGAWSSDGASAVAGAGGTLGTLADLTDDATATFVLRMVTTGTGATQTLRLYYGAQSATAPTGLWVGVSVGTSGGITATLWHTTTGGSSTQLGTFTDTGILANSATPQTVTASITVDGTAVTAHVGTGTLTASITTTERAALGDYLIVSAQAAAAPEVRIDSVQVETPFIPATGVTFTVSAREGLNLTGLATAFPASKPLDVVLTAASQSAAKPLHDALTPTHRGATHQAVTGADVPILTMPSDTLSPTAVAPASAATQIASVLDIPSGWKRVAVISDSTANDGTDWVRVWALILGTKAPAALRRVYNSWDAALSAWRAPVIDAAGDSTPASGGTVLADNFNRTAAELVGSTTSGGQTWTGATGAWSADGATAGASVNGKALTRDVAARSATHTATLRLVTTGTGTTQPWRVYTSATPDAANGLWVLVQIGTTGAVTLALYKTIGLSSTKLADLPVTGILTNSATPQTVTITVQVAVQNVTATVTAGGSPMVTTATITEADYNALGTNVMYLAFAAATPGIRLDNAQVDTPAVPASNPGGIEVWNGSIAGASFTTFDQAKITAMFAPATVGTIDVLVLGLGHNNGTQTPAAFMADIETLVARFRTVHPDAVLLITSQNPQIGTPTATVHLARQVAIRDWARANGHDYIPALEHFLGQPDGGASWTWPDGIHPSQGAGGATTGQFGSIQWAIVAGRVVTDRMLRPTA